MKIILGLLLMTGICLYAVEAPPRRVTDAPPLEIDPVTPLQMEVGTIRFSFRWLEPDSVSFVTMLQFNAPDETFRLYIYPHRHIGLLALRTFQDKRASLNLSAHRLLIDRWRQSPQQLHRIILTWNAEESRLYLDGFPVAIDTRFGKTPVVARKIVWGIPTVHYPQGGGRTPTRCAYELGKLEILDEVMTPLQVIADWRNIAECDQIIDEF